MQTSLPPPPPPPTKMKWLPSNSALCREVSWFTEWIANVRIYFLMGFVLNINFEVHDTRAQHKSGRAKVRHCCCCKNIFALFGIFSPQLTSPASYLLMIPIHKSLCHNHPKHQKWPKTAADSHKNGMPSTKDEEELTFKVWLLNGYVQVYFPFSKSNPLKLLCWQHQIILMYASGPLQCSIEFSI